LTPERAFDLPDRLKQALPDESRLGTSSTATLTEELKAKARPA
jgi:hypothetical protein